MVRANQLILLIKKKLIRGKVQVTSLVWANIVVANDLVLTLKQSQVPAFSHYFDDYFFAFLANLGNRA